VYARISKGGGGGTRESFENPPLKKICNFEYKILPLVYFLIDFLLFHSEVSAELNGINELNGIKEGDMAQCPPS